jgi:hypothetical protein
VSFRVALRAGGSRGSGSTDGGRVYRGGGCGVAGLE